MSFQVIARDVLALMKSTRTEWQDLSSWLSQHKARKEPFTLGDIAEQGCVDYALWAARVLPATAHADLRRLAVAFAMGEDDRVVNAFRSSSISGAFDAVGEAVIGFAENLVLWDEVCRIRFEKSAEIKHLKGAAADALTAVVTAAAPFACGGAALAASYARSAAVALAKNKDDKQQAEAVEEAYQAHLIRYVMG